MSDKKLVAVLAYQSDHEGELELYKIHDVLPNDWKDAVSKFLDQKAIKDLEGVTDPAKVKDYAMYSAEHARILWDEIDSWDECQTWYANMDASIEIMWLGEKENA